MSSQVPLYLDLMGALATRWPGAMVALGNLETKLLTYDIADIRIDRPVFIAGLPRAGSTVIAEILNAHHATCSYQYRDYPFVCTPVFWNQLRRVVPQSSRRVERAHRDGLRINLQSPEAIDEMIWMRFFDHLHDSAHSNILDERSANPAFARFYAENIKKLLMLRRANRFFTKNNANIARLSYIQSIFPDARFIIPIREPVAQVASMVKQDRLFREIQAGDARSRRYTRRLGHFEFGHDFAPINAEIPAQIAEIMEYRRKGDYARAYARYWTAIYDYLAGILANDSELYRASMIVRYDSLCNQPAQTIADIAGFCGLTPDSGMQQWAQHIAPPSYYTPDFDSHTREYVEWATAALRKQYGV